MIVVVVKFIQRKVRILEIIDSLLSSLRETRAFKKDIGFRSDVTGNGAALEIVVLRKMLVIIIIKGQEI